MQSADIAVDLQGVCRLSVKDTLVTDNLHTLAHQRFEDVLLLFAARQHEELGEYVTEAELQLIISKTTEFLQQHSSESATCAADHKILLGVQRASVDAT